MIKTINKLVLGAAMLGASAVSFAAPLPFVVDETPFGGLEFTATEISGVYNEVIQVGAGGSFDATVLLNFNSFINNGSEVVDSVIGINPALLGAGYGMYAVVNFSGQATAGAPNFKTGNWAGTIDMFLDPLRNSGSGDSASLVGINSLSLDDADDSLLFSAGIDFGQSNGTNASASFSLDATLSPLTAGGSAFFVEPQPFYNMLISFGLLNDFFSVIDFTNTTDLQRFNSSANVNFVKVSEPSVLGLLGLGLVFLTLRSRKAK